MSHTDYSMPEDVKGYDFSRDDYRADEADMQNDERASSRPQVTYSRENLLNICENHAHPAIRRIAANMLYAMGERDHAAKSIGAQL